MNCTKCGKEIPDGESKICEECKNSLLTDLQNEPEEVKEKKEEKKNDEFEIKTEKPKKGKKKVLVILFVILLVILAVVGIDYKTNFIKKYILKQNIAGATIGNNNYNFGLSNIQGDWIYYVSYNEDFSESTINKMKLDGTEKTTIIQKPWMIESVNVVGDNIYFVAIDFSEEVEFEGSYNNKIYKMSLNGENLTVINDNNFHEDLMSIYVIKEKVFYVGTDANVYSMDVNGENIVQITESQTGYVGVTDKYIVYMDYPENPESVTDFITYIVDLNGENKRILKNERIGNVNIIGDYVYYINESNTEIRKMKLDGTEDSKIYDSEVYNMIVSEDYIYYLGYIGENEENVGIERVKIDGTDYKNLVDLGNKDELQDYTPFINVVGDWVYYRDLDDNSFYMKMIKVDGSEELKIYKYGVEV